MADEVRLVHKPRRWVTTVVAGAFVVSGAVATALIATSPGPVQAGDAVKTKDETVTLNASQVTWFTSFANALWADASPAAVELFFCRFESATDAVCFMRDARAGVSASDAMLWAAKCRGCEMKQPTDGVDSYTVSRPFDTLRLTPRQNSDLRAWADGVFAGDIVLADHLRIWRPDSDKAPARIDARLRLSEIVPAHTYLDARCNDKGCDLEDLVNVVSP